MWNPFLTPEERAMLRRGRELMRRSRSVGYWSAQSFIIFCAIACIAILILLLAVGAYAIALELALFWLAVYIASSWLIAWDIRRDP